MRMKRVLFLMLIGLLSALTCSAWAGDEPSVAGGKRLFHDTTIGGSTNDRSCAACHPDGEGLETAGKSGASLAPIINRCISGPLAGNAYDEESHEMTSLILYIEYLQGKRLFADASLGGSTNERSCSTCHPGGGDINPDHFKRSELPGLINRCITGPLQGQALEKKSWEMRVLKRYIKALDEKL